MMGIDALAPSPFDGGVTGDYRVAFYYKFILSEYSNFMMWIRTIYGCAWRMLNQDSTFADIYWKNNIDGVDKQFDGGTPNIVSDSWNAYSKKYEVMNVAVDRSAMMDIINSPFSLANTMPTQFEDKLMELVGTRTHLTKTKQGTNSEFYDLSRTPKDVIYYGENCSPYRWIGSSIPPAYISFDVTLLDLKIQETNEQHPLTFYMLDPYTIDISKRLCQQPEFYPPTYI